MSKEKKRERTAAARAYFRENPIPEDSPKHGTLSGYNYYCCRCERCREANSQFYRIKAGGSAPTNSVPKFNTQPSTGNGSARLVALLDDMR